MKRNVALFFFMLGAVTVNGQTDEERKVIASQSNQIGNQEQLVKLQQEEQNRIQRLNNYLQQHPDVNPVENKQDGGKRELMDVLPNGEMIYAETTNAGAALTARANKLYSGGALNINVQGQNMYPALWDGGNVLSNHQEFMDNGFSKVTNMDGFTAADHATHVAGTIAAKGFVSNAKGVAFDANIRSYNWTNDTAEMNVAASTGTLVSNHSYAIGQLNSIWYFGAYDGRAQQFDVISYNNPYYLIVQSAGNDRNDTTQGSAANSQNASKGGYDLIKGQATAKNVMTVAAINQVSSYAGPFSVVMSNFSSYGPSDDGRIKPDISMKGVSVYSSLSTSPSSYASWQGTSMASPGVTGVVTLLQQYHNQLYSSYMKAATVKGLILHTADEAGYTPGPDYRFGWGLINAEKSAIAIKGKNTTTNGSLIKELTLNQGASYTTSVTVNSTDKPLQVSISWTDPASNTVNTGTIDPSDKYLVNDLDVKVTDANGTTYYPWKLGGMSNVYAGATNTSTNDVDNFEKIDISNASGAYTITVTHKGTLTNNSQNFSLIVTSENLTTLSTNEVEAESNSGVYPNPVEDKLNFIDEVSNVEVLDMSGRLVLKFSEKTKSIDFSGFEKGTYLIKYLNNKEEEKTEKIVKK